MSVCGVVDQAPRNANGIFNNGLINERIMACIEEERKKAFVVFASTYEAAVKHLSLEQMGELFLKLGRYSLEGEEDVSSDNPVVDSILISVKPNMDKAELRHLQAIENGMKGKGHGNKGGRPRKGETREEYDARRLERVRNLEEGLENPQKPLNNNTNITTDRNSNIEIKKNTDIKKNTNVEVISNSISTNSIPCYSNPCIVETEYRENPSQETEFQRQDYQLQSEEYLEEQSNEGYELPPIPEEGKMNCLGSIEEIINRSHPQWEPDMDEDESTFSQQEKLSKEEMVAAIRREVDAAIACKKDIELRREHMFNARDTYMELINCSEKRARDDMTWLYEFRKSGDECDFLSNYLS